jgi:NitT/TauT family transport system permease protein
MLPLLRFGFPIVLLAMWHGVCLLAQPELLPTPVQVLGTFSRELQSGELLTHLGATLGRVAISFIFALCIGFVVGALMGLYPWLDAALDGPLLVGLNIPALIVMILCFIWFGLHEATLILAVVLNKAPTMAVIFREGIRSISRDLLEVGQVYRLGRWRTITQIGFPQLIPYLLAATRSGLALVWKIVLVVELLGASSGMGFKLGEFFQFFEVDAVLAYAFAFIAVIVALEAVLVRPWEGRVMAWRARP